MAKIEIAGPKELLLAVIANRLGGMTGSLPAGILVAGRLQLFETIAAEMLETAVYEAQLKRLEEELRKISRRIRVLEEKVMPGIESDLHSIVQYLGEREREAHYCLKRFKQRTSQAVL